MSFQSLYRSLSETDQAEPSEARIKEILSAYPYFSFLHYARLKKKWPDKTYTDRDAAMGALHFNKIFLLNKRLNEIESTEEAITGKKKNKKKVAETAGLSHIADFDNNINEEEIRRTFVPEYLPEGTPAAGWQNEDVVNQGAGIADAEANDREVIVDNTAGEIIVADDNLEQTKKIESSTATEHENEEAVQLTEPIVNNATGNIEINNREVAEVFSREINATTENISDTDNISSSTEHENEEAIQLTEPIVNNSTGAIETNNEEVAQVFSEEVSGSATASAEELPTWSLRLRQELDQPLGELQPVPLHTTDYFASQGIRISEEFAQQKMDGQKRSFTDWLRTMKKLNAGYKTDAERPIDPTVELSLIHI